MKVVSRLASIFLLTSCFVAEGLAACSAWMDRAFLNEYYFGTSGSNFLELYSQDKSFSSSVWTNWKIDVYSAANTFVRYSNSNATQTTCNTGSKTWGVLSDISSLESSHALVILRDENNDPVDVMVFDNGAPPLPWQSASTNYFSSLSSQCSTLASRLNAQAAASAKPYYGQNMVVLSNYGNKDVGRFPDGSGNWSESGLTGSGTTKTQCSSNSPFLTKTASNATVAPGGVATWTVKLINSGNSNLTNQVITDTLTRSSGAPALTGVAATPQSGCGTASGFSSTGGTWTSSVATGANCSLSVSGTVPSTAVAGQTYTNDVTTTLTISGKSYTQTDTATVTVDAPSIDHYEIEVPSVGLTCQSATINVRACASATSPCTSSLASTSTTTTLSASSGSFTSTGGATQTFTGSTSYTLSTPSAETVTIGLSSPTATPICYVVGGSTPQSCSYDVKTAIFQFDVPNFNAGDGSGSVTISALRSDDTTKKCVSFSPSGSVKMWASYANPTSGTKQVALTYGGTGYTLPTSEPGSGNVPLVFDANGQTTFSVNYLDAGQLRLDAKWNSIVGNDSFVVKPYFALTGINCSDSASTANPAATSASGGRFCRAGQSFNLTVKAVTSDGSTSTPNFGQEATKEGAKVTAGLVAPTGGSGGALSGSVNAFADSSGNGQASASYTWSEVGIISLTPGIADGDYLGAGDVAGTAVPYVGRFYPDHFDMVITPLCTGFSYAGQPGTPAVTGQPFTVKATAKNASGGTTSNYNTTGGFSKSLDLSLSAGGTVGKLYVDTVQGGSGAIPASKFSAGVGQVNYNDASGKISYVFNTFPTVQTSIAIHGEDADTASGTPVLPGSDGVLSELAGRLFLVNAYGSEYLSLSVPIKLQFWTANGWTTNVSDSCTALTVPTSANSGLTNTLSGKTTASISSPVSAGDPKFKLTAPGAGNAGLVDISGAILRGANSWLLLPVPTARACFGACGPRSPVIYLRESY